MFLTELTILNSEERDFSNPPLVCVNIFVCVCVCVCTQVGFHLCRCECFEHPLAQCGVRAKPLTETKRQPANLRRHSCIQKWIIKGIHMREVTGRQTQSKHLCRHTCWKRQQKNGAEEWHMGKSGGGILGWRKSSSESVKIPQWGATGVWNPRWQDNTHAHSHTHTHTHPETHKKCILLENKSS